MNVLSLFDGMSCGRVALDRLGIKVDNYFASEVDKYAKIVSTANYPDIIQVGDVRAVNGHDLPKIDLLIGGSPCFVADTKIITQNGYKHIENIEVGDYVLTHKNRFKKVVNIGGKIAETIILNAQGIKPTETTYNHPYYVREMRRKWNKNKRKYERVFSEPIWKAVGELSKGDFIASPINNKSINTMNLTSNAAIIDDIVWLPFKKKNYTKIEKPVYNLEVEDDNSYTANNAIVHNCQSFSMSGKQNGMSTGDIDVTTYEQYVKLKNDGVVFDGQSYLFWEYIRVLKETKPTHFLLENVKMAKQWEQILTKAIGVEPIEINSSHLSAQNRKRLYWTNIKRVGQPADKGIMLKDILEDGLNQIGASRGRYLIDGKMKPAGLTTQRIELRSDNKSNTLTTVQKDNLVVDRDKSHCIDANEKIKNGCIQVGEADLNGHDIIKRIYSPEGKCPTLTAASGGNQEKKVEVVNDVILNKLQEKNSTIDGYSVSDDGIQPHARGRKILSEYGKLLYTESDKTQTVTACHMPKLLTEPFLSWRKLTPLECERLQTLPDNYTNHVSNSQRYKMIGNGWTVDVIAHIFDHIFNPPFYLF